MIILINIDYFNVNECKAFHVTCPSVSALFSVHIESHCFVPSGAWHGPIVKSAFTINNLKLSKIL